MLVGACSSTRCEHIGDSLTHRRDTRRCRSSANWLAVVIWRVGKYEQRFSSGIDETSHSHDPHSFEI